MAISDKNLISDDFWLNMGAEAVYNSVQNRKDAVDRLQRTIVWVFTVYTSISFASVIFADKKSWAPLSIIFFGIAFLFLILGYWQATFATVSVPEDFYGNVAADIRTALIDANKKASDRFKLALILSGIGTVIYSIALLIQFTSSAWHPPVPPGLATDNPITVSAFKINGSGNSYTFNLQSKKSSWNEVFLLHDTTVGKRRFFDTLPPIKSSRQKELAIATDTSGKAVFTISDMAFPKNNVLIVIRSDSLKAGQRVFTEKIKYNIN